jgi:hypothetical protein
MIDKIKEMSPDKATHFIALGDFSGISIEFYVVNDKELKVWLGGEWVDIKGFKKEPENLIILNQYRWNIKDYYAIAVLAIIALTIPCWIKLWL